MTHGDRPSKTFHGGAAGVTATYATIEQCGTRLAQLAAPVRLPPGYGAAALDPALFRLRNVVALPLPGDWRFLTQDGRLVLGGVSVWPGKPAWAVNPAAPVEERVFRVALPEPLAEIEEEYLWLGGPSPANYYHWVIDTLPRLLAFRSCAELWRRPLLVGAACVRYMAEAFDLLAVPAGDLRPLARPVRLRSVCVVSNLSSYGHIHPVAIAALRHAFLPLAGETAGPSRRILVLRRDAGRRRLLNEDEVARWAAARGFEAVSLSGMGFLEQIRLFRQARIVLGAHGAGLTNLVWAQPGGCALVEMAPDAPSLNHFERLAARMALPYRRVVSGRTLRRGDRDGDFLVGCDALDRALAAVEAAVEAPRGAVIGRRGRPLRERPTAGNSGPPPASSVATATASRPRGAA
ncbi:glycosyltransferase family 61 protein [Azospirillum sp.]|uniref:glycosyltransferase family 61 protein n=1 Tax=Azospirillum sp. TaxID=34012 RepID=UPI003D73CBF1